MANLFVSILTFAQALSPEGVYGELHTAEGFLLAEELGKFVHVGALALANEADAPGVPGAAAGGLYPRVIRLGQMLI